MEQQEALIGKMMDLIDAISQQQITHEHRLNALEQLPQPQPQPQQQQQQQQQPLIQYFQHQHIVKHIQNLLQRLAPSIETDNRRTRVVEIVKSCVMKAFSHRKCTIFLYGSSATKTYLPDSDIDLVLCFASDDYMKGWYHTLLATFCEESLPIRLGSITYINAKKMPIVRVQLGSVTVDISCALGEKPVGLGASVFWEKLDREIGQDHLFKRSLLLVKAWMFTNLTWNRSKPLLSSSCLAVLLSSVFHDIEDIRNPVEALFHFVTRFNDTEWHRTTIRYNGCSEMKLDDHYFIHIVDPLNNSSNFAASVNSIPSVNVVKRVFSESLSRFQSVSEMWHNGVEAYETVRNLLSNTIEWYSDVERYGFDLCVEVAEVKLDYSVYECKLEDLENEAELADAFRAPNFLSQRDLIESICQILKSNEERGIVGVDLGSIGSMLHSTMGLHGVTSFIKSEFGGLKKFLKQHSNIFIVGTDHPYNPLVCLRESDPDIDLTAKFIESASHNSYNSRRGRKGNGRRRKAKRNDHHARPITYTYSQPFSNDPKTSINLHSSQSFNSDFGSR